jgi:hypothetical protein
MHSAVDGSDAYPFPFSISNFCDLDPNVSSSAIPVSHLPDQCYQRSSGVRFLPVWISGKVLPSDPSHWLIRVISVDQR